MFVTDSLPEPVLAKFEVFDWRNALAILRHVHADAWEEVAVVLSSFELSWTAVSMKGKGNKSEMAGILDSGLYRCGWIEKEFNTKILIDDDPREVPTHKVDCYKGRVALEVEWNNKDPFYDRDLNNFRLLYDLGVIDVGIIVTRTSALRLWLHQNRALFDKPAGTYGASTTHANKLYPKMRGGGAGGCPVLVFAIKPEAYVDDRPVG